MNSSSACRYGENLFVAPKKKRRKKKTFLESTLLDHQKRKMWYHKFIGQSWELWLFKPRPRFIEIPREIDFVFPLSKLVQVKPRYKPTEMLQFRRPNISKSAFSSFLFVYFSYLFSRQQFFKPVTWFVLQWFIQHVHSFKGILSTEIIIHAGVISNNLEYTSEYKYLLDLYFFRISQYILSSMFYYIICIYCFRIKNSSQSQRTWVLYKYLKAFLYFRELHHLLIQR